MGVMAAGVHFAGAQAGIRGAVFLHHSALFHDRHPVADCFDHSHLVGDEDDGQIQLPVQVLQQLQNGLSGIRVQCGGGLVGEEDLRVVGQGAGDGHALLLAAGQLAGIGVHLVPQVHQIQKLQHPVLDLLLFQPGVPEGISHVFKNRVSVQQVEVLEDHADVPAERLQMLFRQRGFPCALAFGTVIALAVLMADGAEAADADAAGIRLLQKVDAAHQGGFARAGVTYNAVDLAVADAQGDLIDGVQVALFVFENLRDFANLYHILSPTKNPSLQM